MSPDARPVAAVRPEIRECSAADLRALEADLPSHGADLHAAFLRRQQGGGATYLVAWADGRALGSGLIRWQGFPNAESRAALPGIPVISNLGVRPARRGRRPVHRWAFPGRAQGPLAPGPDNRAILGRPSTRRRRR